MCVLSSDFANDVGADSVPKESENSMALILSEITEEARSIVSQMKDSLEDVESLQEVVQHRRVKLVPINHLPYSSTNQHVEKLPSMQVPKKTGRRIEIRTLSSARQASNLPCTHLFHFCHFCLFIMVSIRIISDFCFLGGGGEGRGEGGCCKPVHMGRIFNKSPERSVQASIEPTLGAKGQCVHLFESTAVTSTDLNIFLVY
jgi:hypothetical protein